MTEEKIIEIETTLAHQEKMIEELNDLVRQQWNEIDTLKRRLTTTQNRVVELESNLSKDQAKGKSVTEIAEAEKPPHY